MSSKVDEENPVTTYVKVNEDQKPSNNSAEKWEDDRPSPLFMVNRIVIGIIGVFLGLILFIPNAMMAPATLVGSYVGIAASLSLIAGGLVGAMSSRWIYLLPGFLLQALAIIFLQTSEGV